jgi:hypothetical protein
LKKSCTAQARSLRRAAPVKRRHHNERVHWRRPFRAAS